MPQARILDEHKSEQNASTLVIRVGDLQDEQPSRWPEAFEQNRVCRFKEQIAVGKDRKSPSPRIGIEVELIFNICTSLEVENCRIGVVARIDHTEDIDYGIESHEPEVDLFIRLLLDCLVLIAVEGRVVLTIELVLVGHLGISISTEPG